MATIVVETATAAENIGTGLNWLNPANALVDDVLSASVVFDGISTESKMLWIHDFGFSIPTDSDLILKGINAKVLRTGSGKTEDFEVFLTYGPTPSFTIPSKHQPSFWANDLDGTINYGKEGDIWNRTWDVASEINDSQFGFAISAESPDNLDAGLIDFVEISIFYIHQFDETAVGGGNTGGSADVEHTSNIVIQGGALGGGHGSILFPNIDAIGGALAGGLAIVPVHGIIPLGGVLATGTATDILIYIHPIAGGAIAGGEADPDFADQIDGTGGARLSGSAIVPVHSIFPLGGVRVAGLASIDYTANAIVGGGTNVDASAFVDPVIGDGGAVIQSRNNSTTTKEFIYNPVITSGAIAGGLAVPQQIILVGGGALASGVADIEIAPAIGGGAILGGLAKVTPFIEDGTGGASILVGMPLQETAIIEPFFESGTGGTIASGLARQTQNYDTNLNPNEIQVFARGKLSVPPDDTTAVAICSFTLNPITNILTWRIVHGMGSRLSFVRVRGPTPAGEAGGGVIVSIDTLQDVTVSPIIGSATLTANEVTDYQNELHWIHLRTALEADKLRAQIQSFNSARITPTALTLSTGGANLQECIVGGSADITQAFNPIAGGGLITPRFGGGNDVPVFKLVPITPTGGALAGGLAIDVYSVNEFGDGGAIVSGLAINTIIFANIDGVGGAIITGRSIIAIGPKVGGGGIAGGPLTVVQYTSNPVITGGGLAGGIARQTFIDFFIATAHVLVGGQSLGAKIIFFNTQRNGYGRAMTNNILTVIPDDTVKLIPPTDDVSPELKESRFRIQHNPGWCEVPVKCEEGVLPDVIVKRQKNIVPPKIRQDTPRASSIVSAL